MREYKPFNYCTVCGRSMEDQVPYYPYGYTEIPYCEKCAPKVIRSKDQHRKYALASEENIRRMRSEGKSIESIAGSYYVSESFIRMILKGKE